MAFCIWRLSILNQQYRQIIEEQTEQNQKEDEHEDADTEPKKYHLGCHIGSKNISCTTEYGLCTLELRPSDFCERFASCTDTGAVIKEPEFNACMDCFLDFQPGKMHVSQECKNMFPEFAELFPNWLEL